MRPEFIAPSPRPGDSGPGDPLMIARRTVSTTRDVTVVSADVVVVLRVVVVWMRLVCVNEVDTVIVLSWTTDTKEVTVIVTVTVARRSMGPRASTAATGTPSPAERLAAAAAAAVTVFAAEESSTVVVEVRVSYAVGAVVEKSDMISWVVVATVEKVSDTVVVKSEELVVVNITVVVTSILVHWLVTRSTTHGSGRRTWDRHRLQLNISDLARRRIVPGACKKDWKRGQKPSMVLSGHSCRRR